MKPRHAQLFAQDVPPTKVIRIIDRYVSWPSRSIISKDALTSS